MIADDLAGEPDAREAALLQPGLLGFRHPLRLPAAPREDGCEQSDYLDNCGPYEEERVRRKPGGELDALVQLREVK